MTKPNVCSLKKGGRPYRPLQLAVKSFFKLFSSTSFNLKRPGNPSFRRSAESIRFQNLCNSFLNFFFDLFQRLKTTRCVAQEWNADHSSKWTVFLDDLIIFGSGCICATLIHQDDLAHRDFARLERIECEKSVVDRSQFVCGNDHRRNFQSLDQIDNVNRSCQGDHQSPGSFHQQHVASLPSGVNPCDNIVQLDPFACGANARRNGPRKMIRIHDRFGKFVVLRGTQQPNIFPTTGAERFDGQGMNSPPSKVEQQQRRQGGLADAGVRAGDKKYVSQNADQPSAAAYRSR